MPADETFGVVVAELLGDEARRVSLCGRGLRRAGEFSLDAMIEHYEDVLMELTSTHARARRFPLTAAAPAPEWSASPEDDQWGWAEAFLLLQFLWGVALFVPGIQAYRAYVRALPYVSSLARAGLLLPPPDRGRRCTPARSG